MRQFFHLQVCSESQHAHFVHLMQGSGSCVPAFFSLVSHLQVHMLAVFESRAKKSSVTSLRVILFGGILVLGKWWDLKYPMF